MEPLRLSFYTLSSRWPQLTFGEKTARVSSSFGPVVHVFRRRLSAADPSVVRNNRDLMTIQLRHVTTARKHEGKASSRPITPGDRAAPDTVSSPATLQLTQPPLNGPCLPLAPEGRAGELVGSAH